MDDWLSLASCKGKTQIFFDDLHEEEALNLCWRCPVMEECHNFYKKFQDLEGVFGGKIYKFDYNKDIEHAKDYKGCGSQSGYRKHIYWKEKPCKACRKAHSAYVVARRQVVSSQIEKEFSSKCGTASGWRKHLKEDTNPCKNCLTAIDNYTRTMTANYRRGKNEN